MTYEKFTLRYRPRTFDEIVGQTSVVKSLRGMLDRKKINRTMLIHGPYGSGKTSLARLIATYLNCSGHKKLADDPCGECESCKRMRTVPPSFTDYHEQNAASTRGINDIRSLREQSRFAPSSKKRIFVLDEVHQLTPEAFQAFLKVLEEPPSKTVFILCTTELRKIPRTIISRCARYEVKPVSSEETVKVMQRIVETEGLDIKVFDEDLLNRIAVVVEGNPRDAIETLESVVNNIEGSGGEEDLDQMLYRIVEEVVGETPEKVAAKFLLSVYQGKVTGAVLAMRDANDHGSFADAVLRFHSETMSWRFSPKLRDKIMNAWYSKLEEKFGAPKESGLSPDSLAAVMDVFISAANELKADSVSGYYTLLNTAVKAASICKDA